MDWYFHVNSQKMEPATLTAIISTLRFIANHPLSSKHPLTAYLRFARWQIESRLRREVEFNWIDGSKLVVRNGMAGATGNIYCGLHEFTDMAFLLHLLQPDDLFVDIGANIGSYTVLASAVCHARSFAIEPDPYTFQSLNRNIAANALFQRTKSIEAAIGSESGQIQFTVGKDTTNRVATANDHCTRDVPVRTLDEVLVDENPVLIKMDVEGYEPQVMAAATETLGKASLLAVIIESVDDKVRQTLHANGFEIAHYEPFTRNLAPRTTDRAPQGSNNLFVRDFGKCRARTQLAPRRQILGQQL